MKFFLKIFNKRRKSDAVPKPLRIEGTAVTLTPEPDKAEIAAQALLESLTHDTQKSRKTHVPEQGTAEYYRVLADRIRKGRTDEARLAMRYVAYCEHQLKTEQQGTYYMRKAAELEKGLYQHLDSVEREGGELKRRWQHCLAETIVRQTKQQINE